MKLLVKYTLWLTLLWLALIALFVWLVPGASYA